MKGYVLAAFLVLALLRVNHGDQLKGKLKPEVGKEECEYALDGENPNNIWEFVWRQDCKRDSHNKTIKEKPRWVEELKTTSGLYDPCCTEYMGLVFRQIYNEKRGNGYCGMPDPYQADMKYGRDNFLSIIKAKKIADGQQLDNGRWKFVD